jgi:hypothetical protein
MSKKTMKKKNNSVKKGKGKTGKKGKKLTDWNLFVKKIYQREKKNGKSFKECLKIASKEKNKM